MINDDETHIRLNNLKSFVNVIVMSKSNKYCLKISNMAIFNIQLSYVKNKHLMQYNNKDIK